MSQTHTNLQLNFLHDCVKCKLSQYSNRKVIRIIKTKADSHALQNFIATLRRTILTDCMFLFKFSDGIRFKNNRFCMTKQTFKNFPSIKKNVQGWDF